MEGAWEIGPLWLLTSVLLQDFTTHQEWKTCFWDRWVSRLWGFCFRGVGGILEPAFLPRTQETQMLLGALGVPLSIPLGDWRYTVFRLLRVSLYPRILKVHSTLFLGFFFFLFCTALAFSRPFQSKTMLLLSSGKFFYIFNNRLPSIYVNISLWNSI